MGFAFILALVITYRYQLLLSYSFLYTDSDQTIMWGGLKDYSEGQFYEPRFYGQSYNTFLEALLAVPLYQLGYQPYTALPFVSMCLSIFPFIYLGLLTFFRRSVFYGFVIMSLPLFLPFEYGIITSMPRGFVTGLVFASLAFTAIFFEEKKRFFLLAGLMSAIAFTVNSNSVLISIPLLFYLFLENKKHFSFYFKTVIGICIGLAFHFGLNYFYKLHPNYNLHQMSLEYKLEYLQKGIKNMPLFFNYNSPLFVDHPYTLLSIFFLIGLFFLQQKQINKALCLFIIPPLLIFTLGFNKLHEGTDSIYFHSSRMYLALPLLLAFAFSLFNPRFEPKIYYLWLLIANNSYKKINGNLEMNIEKLIQTKSTEIVIVSPVKPILEDCRRLNKICKKHQVDLFIVANHFYRDAYASGCAACEKDFPKTLNPIYERRTWRLIEDEAKVYNNIMIIDINNKIDTSLTFIKKIPGTVDLYLVKNNTFKTFDLLDTLGISYRRFK